MFLIKENIREKIVNTILKKGGGKNMIFGEIYTPVFNVCVSSGWRGWEGQPRRAPFPVRGLHQRPQGPRARPLRLRRRN